MVRIPLHNILERVLKIKDINSEKELDDLVMRLRYDKKYKAEVDQLLAKLTEISSKDSLNQK